MMTFNLILGIADTFNEDVLNEISETTVLISESSVQTNNAVDNLVVEKTLAGFIHRSDTETSPTECKVRSRLTPSGEFILMRNEME
jgi:hypothetical protein